MGGACIDVVVSEEDVRTSARREKPVELAVAFLGVAAGPADLEVPLQPVLETEAVAAAADVRQHGERVHAREQAIRRVCPAVD